MPDIDGDIGDIDVYMDALEFTLHLKPEYRKCRFGRHHDFLNGEQVHGRINRDGTLHTETRCARCGTIIIEDMTARGYYIKTPRYIWPDDYLKKPGETGLTAGEHSSAAMRAVQVYERLGHPLPDTVRRRPRKKSA